VKTYVVPVGANTATISFSGNPSAEDMEELKWFINFAKRQFIRAQPVPKIEDPFVPQLPLLSPTP
jgi:hypothetical protein